MANDGIKVVGLNNAIRALKDLGVPAKEIAQAGTDAGNIIAKEARSLVPVRTGNLKDTIRVSKAQTKVVVRAGKAKVPYANPIHWGWFRRGIKPNEFFSRAIAENIDAVASVYFENLQKLIDKYK
jgi:HK97 gp10 family phage protein